MEIIKLKNNQEVTDVWFGIVIEPGEYYTIQSDQERVGFSTYQKTLSDITSDPPKLIVNDGIEDLSPNVGSGYLQRKIVKMHTRMDIVPGVGTKSPEVVELNGATMGYKVQIGDKGYLRSKAENIIGDYYVIVAHFCIDNDQPNKYASYRIHLLTSNGNEDKYLNTSDLNFDVGPVPVTTDPFRIFSYEITLPVSLFANDEKYIFMGLERIANEEGYDNPTNDPIIVSIYNKYWQRVID